LTKESAIIMIGQTIAAKPKLAVWPILILILGLVLLGVGVGLGNWNFDVGATGPLILAGAIRWNRPRPFIAHFTETKLQLENPARSIPYEEIESVYPYGRHSFLPFAKGKDSYFIEIVTPEGPLVIPSRLDVPSVNVYLFLFQLCGQLKKRRVPSPQLRDYFQENLERYGKDRVHAFKKRSHHHMGLPFDRRLPFLLLILDSIGCVWFACGLALREVAWVGSGFLLVFLGLLMGARVISLYAPPAGVFAIGNTKTPVW